MWRKRISHSWCGSRFLLLAFFSILFSVESARSAPLDAWHWRNPLPQGNALNNVIFANGQFMALGDFGTILTSSDGTNWVQRESGVSDRLRDCAYGAGTYVIVGDLGTVLTSTNGITWTSHYGGTFYSLNAVTYANGQFVGVGEQTTIVTSPDGVTWTLRASGEWELFDVIEGNGVFVAVGGVNPTSSTPASAVVLSSDDGVTWYRRVLQSDYPFASIGYANGTFVAVNRSSYYYSSPGRHFWTSANGWDWSPNELPTLLSNPEMAGLCYGNGNWVFVGGNAFGYPSEACTILTSTNLVDWNLTLPPATLATGVAFGNSRFVVSLSDGTFLTSGDGLQWVRPLTEPYTFWLYDLEYLNGSFVGTTYYGFSFSSNGMTWTNTTPTNAGPFVSVTYGNGLYVAGGQGRTVWVSENALDWTNPAPDISIYPTSGDVYVAHGNGLFVGAAGPYGDIITSSDGFHWDVQQLETNTSAYFNGIAFGGGRFVAVGGNATATSTDGTNWVYTSGGPYLRKVAYGNGKFVGVGVNVIAVSDNGINWTSQSSFQFGPLNDIAFGAGLFVAVPVSSYGPPPTAPPGTTIWISTDAIHWSSRQLPTDRSGWYDISFGDGTFVVGSDHSAILQSDPLVNLSLTLQPAPQLLVSGPNHRSYRIDHCNGLSPDAWTPLVTVAATNMPLVIDNLSTSSVSHFYRAILLP